MSILGFLKRHFFSAKTMTIVLSVQHNRDYNLQTACMYSLYFVSYYAGCTELTEATCS